MKVAWSQLSLPFTLLKQALDVAPGHNVTTGAAGVLVTTVPTRADSVQSSVIKLGGISYVEVASSCVVVACVMPTGVMFVVVAYVCVVMMPSFATLISAYFRVVCS